MHDLDKRGCTQIGGVDLSFISNNTEGILEVEGWVDFLTIIYVKFF